MGKVILIGFDELETEGVRLILSSLAEVLSISEEAFKMKLKDVLDNPPTGFSTWNGKRFAIIHEAPPAEIVKRIKALQLGEVIFATSTPTSLNWKLERLLRELEEEDEHFSSR